MSHTPKTLTVSTLSLFTLVVIAAASGCSEGGEEGEDTCAWVNDPSECKADGDDEAGDDEPLPDPCVTIPDGIERTVHQCEGSLSASISFNTLLGDCGESIGDELYCSEFHAFGPNEDAYEAPAVMACCTTEDGYAESTYLSYCGADMIEQFCASLPYRLQSYIDQGLFEVGENQAQNLADYLNNNQADCYANFYKPTETPGEFETSSWLVNGGGNGNWPLLNDFTITLNSAAVTSATLPEDPADYLSCYDNDFNNTEIFEDELPTSPGINSLAQLTDASTASMVGPVVQGGRVTGIGGLGSQASGCQDPWCSNMEVTVDQSTNYWTLEDLNLFADGVVSFTNGTSTLDIERGAIRLYHVGLGTIQTDRSGVEAYTIQAGDAGFTISGASGFAHDLRWGRNASPITMHESGSGWEIDSFVIEHVDSSGERWTVTLPRTTWD